MSTEPRKPRGCGNLPVVAMRLAADRLGRGRLGLTQRDGDEAQEGGGICSDLHVDFRNVVAGSTEWERAARWMSEWVGGATTINAGCERYMKRPRRPTVARCNQPGTKNKPRSEVPYTAGIDSACRQGAPPQLPRAARLDGIKVRPASFISPIVALQGWPFSKTIHYQRHVCGMPFLVVSMTEQMRHVPCWFVPRRGVFGGRPFLAALLLVGV
jgi:hypothetical protein